MKMMKTLIHKTIQIKMNLNNYKWKCLNSAKMKMILMKINKTINKLIKNNRLK